MNKIKEYLISRADALGIPCLALSEASNREEILSALFGRMDLIPSCKFLCDYFTEEELLSCGIYVSGYHEVVEGSIMVCGDAMVVVRGEACVDAYEVCQIKAYGNTTVRGHGSSCVESYDMAKVELYDYSRALAHWSSTVDAGDYSRVEAYDTSSVVCRDKSWVSCHDNSRVRAYNGSIVEAEDSSYVESYDYSFVRAYGDASVRACHDSVVLICGNDSRCVDIKDESVVVDAMERRVYFTESVYSVKRV